MKCECGAHLKYQGTVDTGERIIRVFRCQNPNCGKEWEERYMKNHPSNCSHQWGFEGWGFQDGPYSHEIYWNMVCDYCGKREKVRFDSRSVGLRESVDIEDPRVMQFLDVNQHTAPYLFGKDEAKEFWGQ